MADLYKTRRQLIYQALDNLGVMATGQTPSDEDVMKVDNLIDPMMADLADRDVIYVQDYGLPIADGGEIPPSLFLHLATILADHSKSAWGMQGDPSFYVLATQAEDKLRNIKRPERTKRRAQIEPVLQRHPYPKGWPYSGTF